MQKIKYEDLSIWIKIPLVMAWIAGITYAIAFMVGFIGGMI